MTTKEAIQKEFMKEYRQKNYQQITVKELCRNTPVARTTFYSYYQNTDELKEEIENNLINGIVTIASEVTNNPIAEMDFSVFFTLTLEYIQKYWNDIHTFLILQPNLRFIQKWKDAIKTHFALRFPHKCGAVNFELISETIAAAIIGAYSYWLKNPEQVDIGKLNQIVMSALETIDDII